MPDFGFSGKKNLQKKNVLSIKLSCSAILWRRGKEGRAEKAFPEICDDNRRFRDGP